MDLLSLKYLFFLVLVVIPLAQSQVDEWHANYDTIGMEKVTRLRFYHHDSKDSTVVTMVEAPTTKDFPTFFGLLGMTDNILTEGPESTSTCWGRAQGLPAASSREEFTFVMATSFVFKEGNFNGSSLRVLGRNPFMDLVRELPIVGGTSTFRFARGFAVVKTHWVNAATHDLIEEYQMRVMHY
ncbi:hypothetical protein MKX01_033049 [Papaver californicum]|nr:hypothetical protein MKX01_033049 [Papaver californicum]